MLTSYVDHSQTRKSFSIELPADVVKRATDATARTVARKVRLPGFRPGKVPVDVVLKRFADDIKAEVLEQLVNDAVRETLVEKKLSPLGQPKVEDVKFELDQPLSFRVDLEVRPPIAPRDYKGLKVPTEPIEARREEIDGVLEKLRERHAAYEPIEDRPAMDGDFAMVDVHGTFPGGDGKDFDAEKVFIELGGDKTMPEMSGHLRNAMPGETVTFQKDFPPDAQDPEFAGKTVLYNVTLVALKKRTLPPLDDELARQAMTPRDGEPPEDASIEKLREQIAESIRHDKEHALEEKKRRSLLDALLALNNEVEAPDLMVEAEIDSAIREYARSLSRQGVDLKETKIDWNSLRKEARPMAERRVREYLLLDAIGEAEGIEMTDTELDAAIKRRASAIGSSFGELKSALVKNERLEGTREELRIEKVMALLLKEATTV